MRAAELAFAGGRWRVFDDGSRSKRRERLERGRESLFPSAATLLLLPTASRLALLLISDAYSGVSPGRPRRRRDERTGRWGLKRAALFSFFARGIDVSRPSPSSMALLLWKGKNSPNAASARPCERPILSRDVQNSTVPHRVDGKGGLLSGAADVRAESRGWPAASDRERKKRAAAENDRCRADDALLQPSLTLYFSLSLSFSLTHPSPLLLDSKIKRPNPQSKTGARRRPTSTSSSSATSTPASRRRPAT